MKKFSLIPLTRTEIIVGCCYLLLQMTLLPILLSYMNFAFSWSLDDAQLNFIYFCINFACAVWIFRHYLLRQLSLLKAAYRKVLCYTLYGFGINYFATMVFGMLIQYLYPQFSNANDGSITQLVQDSYTLTAVGTILLVPPVEELLYRALMFGQLYRWNRIGAYAISIFVFSAIHVVGYIGYADPISLAISFLQYIPASFCLCWAYERSGSIFAPMLIHIAVNQIGISIMR